MLSDNQDGSSIVNMKQGQLHVQSRSKSIYKDFVTGEITADYASVSHSGQVSGEVVSEESRSKLAACP